jgi:hypothetical protein
MAQSEVRPLPRHLLGVRDARRCPLGRRARMRLRCGGHAVSQLQSFRQGSSAAPAEGLPTRRQAGRRLMTQAHLSSRGAEAVAMTDEQFRIIRGLLVTVVILLGLITGILLALAWDIFEPGATEMCRPLRPHNQMRWR